MFRRRNAGADGDIDGAGPGTLEDDADRVTAGHATTPAKGRPTPKRSEAERRRRNQAATPAGRKAATSKSRDRADRARKYEAMKRGEEWALAARDRGPIKALTRDYVDSKRRLSEFYMYILLVLMVLLFARSTGVAVFLYPLVLVLVVVIVIEGILVSRAVRKLAAQRYPGESTRGVTMYAIMRSLQIRRFRMPAPRVKPGGKA